MPEDKSAGIVPVLILGVDSRRLLFSVVCSGVVGAAALVGLWRCISLWVGTAACCAVPAGEPMAAKANAPRDAAKAAAPSVSFGTASPPPPSPLAPASKPTLSNLSFRKSNVFGEGGGEDMPPDDWPSSGMLPSELMPLR